MRYAVIIEQSKDGSFWTCVPDLPGCISCGDTREEAERNIAEAISLHIESLREHGELVLPPSASTAMVEAA